MIRFDEWDIGAFQLIGEEMSYNLKRNF